MLILTWHLEFISVAENLLQGSIATEADSQLSWSGAEPAAHATVVRFAAPEDDEFDDNEEVNNVFLLFVYIRHTTLYNLTWML